MSMFIRTLEEIADLFAQFGDPVPTGARTWNGTAYIVVTTSSFDPYAAKWWSALTALAGILSSQEALSEGQREFLDRFLFGGMGSLNDFALDEGRLGIDAKQANRELNRLRTELFSHYQRLEKSPRRCCHQRRKIRDQWISTANGYRADDACQRI